MPLSLSELTPIMFNMLTHLGLEASKYKSLSIDYEFIQVSFTSFDIKSLTIFTLKILASCNMQMINDN